MSAEKRRVSDVIAACNISDVIEELEKIAVEEFNGHLTIMRFTTGWKVMLGTPDLTQDGRLEVLGLLPATQLVTAMRLMLGERRLP